MLEREKMRGFFAERSREHVRIWVVKDVDANRALYCGGEREKQKIIYPSKYLIVVQRRKKKEKEKKRKGSLACIVSLFFSSLLRRNVLLPRPSLLKTEARLRAPLYIYI